MEEEIRKGHLKYERLIEDWEKGKRPGRVQFMGKEWMVLQDPESTEFFFREIKQKVEPYETRSFGGKS